ncbi:ABC-three component system middle component 2 [Leptolyngbya sp. CCNP1308]|uniref:ABC-three component system middle component 2 n=1 Tax=Leptolyngbya sp. CCNP1308 TaxID=3110255 RepID=UPI002B1FA8B8|nr:ABC-three component system middle component 2 [Leptolyngbya sp. CCNP1308]MEA5449317.1 ABC-three component system middle component 2 [Leptolyngbya sp. CCNP1308]
MGSKNRRIGVTIIMPSPFNSPLESGVRSLSILVAAFPRSLDLQYLVFFDYLTVHSRDVDGPESLHAPIPMRSGELAVRRGLIERGLLLMISRDLIERLAQHDGFSYVAADAAAPFLDMLGAEYTLKLRKRSNWVISTFGNVSTEDIRDIERRIYHGGWASQFQLTEGVTDRR